MAVYELTLPVDDATIEKLHVGDIIYIDGQVCTARDIAHLNMRELVEEGKPLPEDIRGGAIFHAGPVMKKDENDKWYLSVIGPTTSIRMEPHADFVGQQGVKVIIGKGGSMLKKVSTLARQDMERFMGTKVYLQTWVKVKENWRDNPAAIQNFGYKGDKA